MILMHHDPGVPAHIRLASDKSYHPLPLRQTALTGCRRWRLELIPPYNPDWQLPDGPPPAPRVDQANELWAVDPEKPDRLTVYG